MKLKLILILSLLKFCATAQNFNNIPNWSFEDMIKCVIGDNLPYIKNWYNPTNQGTPDAYVKCMDDVLPSSMDEAKRHFGYNRIGLIVYDSTYINVREYVAIKLQTNLISSKKYCADLYIIPMKRFKYASNDFGVYFGTGNQYYIAYYNITSVTPQLTLPPNTFINDTAHWYHFKGVYTAQGGESDIVIGSFKDDSQITLQVINTNTMSPLMSYFILDDVSLHEMSLNIGNDTTVCAGDDFTIGEQNLDTAFNAYYWYHNGVLIDSLLSQKTIQLNQTDSFVVEKRFACGSVWDTIHITVLNNCPLLITPNIFTPNNDGINDKLEFRIKNAELQLFEIYNRWGVQIFKSTTQPINNTTTISWDGRSTSGEPCSDGVYYYILETKNKKGELEKQRGYISLVR